MTGGGSRGRVQAAVVAALLPTLWACGRDQRAAEAPSPGPAAAVGEPATDVDLPIPNLPQQTPVWCWVAVAQQIIMASKGPEKTPAQCALVAQANDVSADTCCRGYNPACVRTGSIEQIQDLIEENAGRGASHVGPADPATLHRALAGGHAVIMGMDIRGSGHVVVVRGMSFQPTPEGPTPFVHVNDPMAMYTQPVPFAAIVPYWRTAIVVN